MWNQIWGAILSKVGELIANYAHKKLESKFNLITLTTLQKNLELLSVKACDVEEQIKHAERSGQKKRKREVEEWLEEVKSIETQVVELGTRVESQRYISIERLRNGGEAAPLNEQVCKLLERASHFGELLLDCGTRGEKMLTTRMVGKAFERTSEKIWRLLEGGQVSSIGVYGMGGVGKTTLAKGIYNQLQETYGERSVFWVTVSQEFTIKSLQDKIGRLLGVELLDEDNEDIRAGRVHEALSKRKNVVLIFDDVWQNIDLLKVGCPFSVERCRLIMTTRSLDVCCQIGCEEKIAVRTLGEDEAWKLFHETFTLGKEINLDPQVEVIAKSVAKLCGGLPLGIITLAGSMRGHTSIHAWRNALVELKECFADQDGMREGEVFKVLKYSFDRLHANESKDFNSDQLCFLYLSLYPEDEEVWKDELIEKFISEGLLDTRKSRRAQFDQGHVILDKLVNSCLLESGVKSFGEYLKMHDLVRGMALEIGRGKNMVRAGERSLKEIPEEEEWRRDIEKVSLMKNGIQRIEDETSPNCPNLSTLLLQDNPLEFIPDSFFSKMHGLCTVDLGGTYVEKLPQSLSDLTSLTALHLQFCFKLEYVPYIGNLKALRQLNLSRTAIKEVPQGVEELLNLKLLSMEAYHLEVLPRGLLTKLVNLQYLSFPCHLVADIEGLENLKEVEEFRGRVKSVRDFNRFITSRVHDTFYRVDVGALSDVDYSLRGYNKILILHDYRLEDEKISGQHIESLRIWRCEGLSGCLLDDFSESSIRAPSLRRLIINNCKGIEYILMRGRKFEILSSVEDIQLGWLEDFKGMIPENQYPSIRDPAEAGTFSCLRRLDICECNKMRKLGLPVLEFPNLETIKVRGCEELKVIFEDVEERRESVTLPKLTSFTLRWLPRLESVCRTTLMIFCNSIEKIHIEDCPRLKKLPLHLDNPPPPNLRQICVEREWWKSLEWDNPHLPHLLPTPLLI